MSETVEEQQQVLKALREIGENTPKSLLIQNHIEYMLSNLLEMKKKIVYFDYGQPWVYYYVLNSMSLLGAPIPENLASKIISALKHCWNQRLGGFGGGYKQLPHLAPTYAAVLSIILLGQPAYHLLDREGLTKFFWSCKKGGEFEMTQGAQFDLRGAYIVTIIVKLLNLDEKLLEGVAENIIDSQTYEGGLSNVKGGQAHGGYTFCGVSALSMLGKLHQADVPRLLFWLSRRQCEFGGFNGRTNKLLDSCYSFWVGAIFNVLNNYFKGGISFDGHLLYNEEHLQEYITFYCQQKAGGLKDKPGKSRDIYHTCYSLSGMSLSQQTDCRDPNSRLAVNDPIYNVNAEKLEHTRTYFRVPPQQNY